MSSVTKVESDLMNTLESIKNSHNKEIQVVIGKPLRRWGRELFDQDVPILRYPEGTKIGRIFIDTGIAKSWSEVNGTHWNSYCIQKGWTDIFLDNQKIQKYTLKEMKNLSGYRPHRLSILNLSKTEE
jgi:hypothetical protein